MAERMRLGLPSGDPCPGKHCSVTGGASAGDPGERRPGLLVGWRQAGDHGEGRVVYISCSAVGRWVLTEEWLPARQLLPA